MLVSGFTTKTPRPVVAPSPLEVKQNQASWTCEVNGGVFVTWFVGSGLRRDVQ